MILYYGIMACLFLKACSFINFILACEEILHGDLIFIVCISSVTALKGSMFLKYRHFFSPGKV